MKMQVTQEVFLIRDAGRWNRLDATERTVESGPRVPRISKLMALAIRFQQHIHDGVVRDITELADLAHVSQPRMTQIMNLNHLGSDIQEELLFLPAVECGKPEIHEKMLRPIAAEVSWERQRELWGN